MNLMMKKLIRCAVLVASSVLGIGSLSARTVAWYHFNEGANGTKPAGGQPVIMNAADPTSLSGYPYALTGTRATGTTGNLPAFTNDMPSCVSWFDPVTGARGGDNRSIFLKTNNQRSGYPASTILINDDAQLHCQNITVEMMVKSSPEAAAQHASGDWLHALTMLSSGSSNTKAWGIMFLGGGRVICTINNSDNVFNGSGTSGNDGSGGGAGYLYSATVSGSVPKVTDGKWHHVAMTYDGEAVRIYVDYVQRGYKAWSGPLVYDSGNAGKLCIGGNYGTNYGAWDGFIDELRISDEALPVEKFLRIGGSSENAAKVTDQDTALYLPFDSAEICNDKFFGSTNAPIVLNAACSTNAYNIKVAGVYLANPYILPSLETSDIVSNTFHSGIFAAESATNGGCWKFGQNTAAPGKSIHIAVDDYEMNNNSHLITSGDFTLEFWLNVPGKPSKTCYIIAELAKSADTNPRGQPGTLLIYTVVDNDGRLRCRLVSDSELDAYQADSGYSIKYVDMDATGVFDGKWHHFALVVDRTHRTATFYADGKAVKQARNFVLASRVANTATYKPLEISGGWGPDRTDEFHELSIDELRITRRALAPQEFLSAGVASDADARAALDGDTRAWIGFEGDLSAKPSGAAVEGYSTASTVSMVYSQDVPGVRRGKMVDGNGTVLRESNTSSMYFSGAFGSGDTPTDTYTQRLFFERNIFLERDMKSMTVEFFMKGTPSQAKAWTSIVRLYGNATGADTNGERLWGLGYKDTAGHIYVLLDNNGTTQALYYPDDTVSLADGRWHHIAATYEPDGNGNTLCKVYKDYEQLGTTKTFTGELECGDHGMSSFAIGSRYNGYIDEVRVSKGVLSVDQMLHVNQGGLVIVVR